MFLVDCGLSGYRNVRNVVIVVKRKQFVLIRLKNAFVQTDWVYEVLWTQRDDPSLGQASLAACQKRRFLYFNCHVIKRALKNIIKSHLECSYVLRRKLLVRRRDEGWISAGGTGSVSRNHDFHEVSWS